MTTQRNDSDESYVIDLCDKILRRRASRQHRFDFLRGDSRTDKPGRRLPCDAYWEPLNLVVEYHERQHDHPVPIMDKRMTVSGVSRREQRKRYDDRRRRTLPRYGITLVVIKLEELKNKNERKLLRDTNTDEKAIRKRLARWVPRYRR